MKPCCYYNNVNAHHENFVLEILRIIIYENFHHHLFHLVMVECIINVQNMLTVNEIGQDI